MNLIVGKHYASIKVYVGNHAKLEYNLGEAV